MSRGRDLYQRSGRLRRLDKLPVNRATPPEQGIASKPPRTAGRPDRTENDFSGVLSIPILRLFPLKPPVVDGMVGSESGVVVPEEFG
jgi:hypothetical protein